MSKTEKRLEIRRRSTLGRSAALFLALALVVLMAPVASAQVPWEEAVFSGFSTGSTFHADAIQLGTTRLENLDEALSASTVNSQNLGTALQNEMQVVVQPSLPEKNSFGRGSPLEIGLVQTTPVTTAQSLTVLNARADASAPPTTPMVTREVLTQKVDPAVYASVLRGQAAAQWDENYCPIGSDISFGRAYAADLQLVDAGGNTQPDLDSPVIQGDATNPDRNVAWTETRTRLVPQIDKAGNRVGNNWGLMTEVHQTYAPITILEGGANQRTIEVLGEWVLRAVALGVEGSYIHYGPKDASPQTPVVRILDASGAVIQQVTSQQLVGATGLTQNLPIGQIAIGEDPRAIATPPGATPDFNSQPTVTPTEVSGAVDVVRLITEIAAAGLQIEDLRIGHMEVKAQVPAGGIICGLGVTKEANPIQVVPGEEFTYTIVGRNPFDCVATNVRLTDTITVSRGVRYSVVSSNPEAESNTVNRDGSRVMTWSLPDLQPKSLTQPISITILVDRRSASGVFTNNAVLEALCGTADAQGRTGIASPVRAETTIELPRVGNLPATGAETYLYALMGVVLLGGAFMLTRSMRPSRIGKDSS
ncbi:MAG TPA: LPXTG cell wall anchor domain-containing protein [Actinomycetota bacterium]|nr:LPXTG cell wall anchor domain-containing protein [Actinomycetota bacterium]